MPEPQLVPPQPPEDDRHPQAHYAALGRRFLRTPSLAQDYYDPGLTPQDLSGWHSWNRAMGITRITYENRDTTLYGFMVGRFMALGEGPLHGAAMSGLTSSPYSPLYRNTDFFAQRLSMAQLHTAVQGMTLPPAIILSIGITDIFEGSPIKERMIQFGQLLSDIVRAGGREIAYVPTPFLNDHLNQRAEWEEAIEEVIPNQDVNHRFIDLTPMTEAMRLIPMVTRPIDPEDNTSPHTATEVRFIGRIVLYYLNDVFPRRQ